MSLTEKSKAMNTASRFVFVVFAILTVTIVSSFVAFSYACGVGTNIALAQVQPSVLTESASASQDHYTLTNSL